MNAHANVWQRMVARSSFAWDYSERPAAKAARIVLDTRLRRLTSAVSTPRDSGPSLGYAGIPDGVTKILQMLERQRERMGSGAADLDRAAVTAADVFRRHELPRADLVAVVGTRSQLTALPRRASLVLPYRLHAVVDSSVGWQARMSKGERQWCKTQCTRRGLRMTTVTDDAAFDFFYDRMHVPTMRSRHGARARSENRIRAYECLFKRGHLLLVMQDDSPVAGALATVSGDDTTLTPRLGGLLDGSAELHESGLLRLMSYLIVDWAERNTISTVDFSGLEAWIANGLYGYKRRLAPRLERPADYRGQLEVWWHARRDTPQVRDFLVRNPVLEEAGGGRLRAVYFHDAQRPVRDDIPHTCLNVDDRRSIHLDDFLAGVPTGRPSSAMPAPAGEN
ncbi:GNAT family N-acetyltransferase [Couchioplanes caeruleus]|uniref:Acetyltransferase (GNAT) family protein n=1 Tax=Couchioplanes caeruleus TaxID=56438 RepID=A0A3N1GM89_9ACTN|nr:GNAT family N-acetyltransferase [Couchioplanes caeruleus]ROP31350.1 acetyltransferase (GNAT) family protein [Couchioplanes caeruleus]